jgi:acyl carrier protein
VVSSFPGALTDREAAVAREILRLARDELAIAAEPAPDEPLAGRLDSLQLLSLVVAVEDRFHVILSDDDAQGTRSLEDLARLVASRASPERLAGPADGPTRDAAGPEHAGP